MTFRPGLFESTLNTRFLVVSVLLALGTVGAVFFTHRIQSERLTVHLLARAEAAAENDPKRAQRWYRDYLKLRQDDLVARIQLAKLQMQTADSPGQWMAAFRTNEAVLRADVDQTGIRRKQVDVCFRLGRFQEARQHLEKLLQPNLKDGALRMLLGIAFESDRRYREAAREFGLAIEDDEFQSVRVSDQEWTPIQAYANRARILYEELDDPNGADRVIRAALKEYPSSPEAFLMRAMHLSRTGQKKSAAADSRKAVELDPGNLDALTLAAELTLTDPTSSQEDMDSLHESLRAVVSNAPGDDSRPYALLAEFERRKGDTEKAITTLEEGVEQTTENEGLTSLLVSQLISLGRIDQARATLDKKEKSAESKNDPDSLYLEGGILLREGQPAESLKLFQNARTGTITDSQLYQLASVQIGRCWLAMGRPNEALKEFNGVVRVDAGSVESRAGMATALAAIGRPLEALRARRQLPVENLSAALELARLELRVVMGQLPNDRNWKSVEAALQAADGFDPDSNQVSLDRAMMLTASGKREEAQQILQVAATRRPVHVDVIGALTQMALAEGDADHAQSLLDKAATQLENDPDLDRYQLILWKETDPERFKDALQEFENKEYSAASGNRYRLLESIAAWHRGAGDRNRELDVLLKAAESRANHVDSWLRLLRPALDLDRNDVRDRTMAEMQRMAGEDDVRVRYAKAMVLIRESGDNKASSNRTEARKLLQEIVAERNDWSPPYVLLGQLDLTNGKRGEAAEWYRLAVLHGNRQPAILRMTSRLLLDQMRSQDAIMLFEEIRGSATGALRNTTTQLLRKVFATQDRESDILQLIRDDVASGAVGSMDRIMRGNMLWKSGDYDAAEAEFRKAVEHAPSEANGWLVLTGFLVRRGNTTAAAEVVNQAEAVLAEAGNLVVLARCLELVGRTREAEEQLANAMKAEPTSGAARLSLASFYVRTKRWKKANQIIDPVLKNPEEFPGINQLAVRRLKVRTIAFTSFAGYKNALDLLQKNIDEAVDRSTDQRILARLQVSRKHPDFVREGLRLFSVVERKVALSATEELVVARACDRLRHDHAAEERWNGLLTNHSRHPKVIEGYVRRQLKRGDLAGLREHLEQLEALQPSPWPNVRLSTGLDLREGMIDAASSRIDQYIVAAEGSAERINRVKQSASLLAALASSPQLPEAAAIAAFEKADAFYQELTTTDKESILPYAQLIAQHGNLEQALDLLEREESAIPKRLRGAHGTQLMQYAAHDDPQVERVHQWVGELRQQNPGSVQFVFLEAAVCLRRQQYDKAMQLNRQVIKQNPEQIAALNNLAWILGTQKGEYGQAIELLETAMKVAGPAAFLLDTRGLVSLEAGRVHAAIDDFEAAWRQDNLPSTQYHLAVALAESGDRASARTHLQQALAAGLRPHMLDGPEVVVLEELQSELGLKPDAAKE